MTQTSKGKGKCVPVGHEVVWGSGGVVPVIVNLDRP